MFYNLFCLFKEICLEVGRIDFETSIKYSLNVNITIHKNLLSFINTKPNVFICCYLKFCLNLNLPHEVLYFYFLGFLKSASHRINLLIINLLREYFILYLVI